MYNGCGTVQLPVSKGRATMTSHDFVHDKSETIPIFANQFGHGLRVAAHGHDCVEIAYFIKGTATHLYEDQGVFMAAGDVVIIPPNTTHSYTQNRSVTVFNCQFAPIVLQSDLDWLRKMDGFFDLFMVEPFFRNEVKFRDKLKVPDDHRPEVEGHFQQIRRELNEKATGFELAAKTHLVQLIILFCRLYSAQKNASPWTNELSGKSALLREAIHYIEENFSERIAVEELAAAFYISPDHFSRLFRQSTGVSPIEYINHLRISKASQLLVIGGATVSEVAAKVGIQDPSYFTRLFKQITGQTPLEHRAESEG